MSEVLNKFKQAYIDNDLIKIVESSKKFAWFVTKHLVNNEIDELKELCLQSAIMRDDIEFEADIKKNKEYYYGYWFAYENLARRLIECTSYSNKIELIVNQYPKVREIIRFLYINNFAQQNEIASHIGVTPSHLWNILNKAEIKELNIFDINKVGRNVVYSLNSIGKSFYNKQINNNEKIFTKEQVMKIIQYMIDNMEELSIDSVSESLDVLDMDMISKIKDKFILYSKLQNKKYININVNVNIEIKFDKNNYLSTNDDNPKNKKENSSLKTRLCA